MSITLTHPEMDATRFELSWTSPADDLWVAKLNGEYAGMVEFADGHFIARGHTAELIDNFSSIPDAKAAVQASAVAAFSAA